MHDIEHCVPTRIEVCVDCVSALAEGEVIDGHGLNVAAEHSAKLTEQWGDVQISLGAPPPEPDPATEPYFRDRPCQGCGSAFPGGRFTATAWTPSPFLAAMPELATLAEELSAGQEPAAPMSPRSRGSAPADSVPTPRTEAAASDAQAALRRPRPS